MIHFDVITVFPEIISQYAALSIIGRAQKQGAVTITAHDLRQWATDKHRTVDDRVYGGAAGMLMKVEPIYRAISELQAKAKQRAQVIATDASGILFSQKLAHTFASRTQDSAHYILLCGHYEGFDARVYEFVDYKLAVGPYIVTGGELPALIIIDAVTRLLPGVLGNNASAVEETEFTFENEKLLVTNEHPQYTTPASFTFTDSSGTLQTREVPPILRSGHHKKIADVNKSQRVKKTLTL
ncbi:MAG: tRNA (guanosine(37)-N1)-methyltransferase TrmD [Candidatus Dojkabacteria bacterium]|nr:MAG: tRNA (guanosine(37)-N1)-methyltransferase TrmD [Candidatus Dojkabacteria bacterium]